MCIVVEYPGWKYWQDYNTTDYGMAGNSRGVLIFVLFVTDRQSRKFSPTKINDYEHTHAHKR